MFEIVEQNEILVKESADSLDRGATGVVQCPMPNEELCFNQNEN